MEYILNASLFVAFNLFVISPPPPLLHIQSATKTPRSSGAGAVSLIFAASAFGPVLSARFRRAPLNIARRSAAKIWPRPRLYSVVAFSLAAFGTCYTQVFFRNRRGPSRPLLSIIEGEPRPPVRCVFHRWRVFVEPSRRGVAAPVMV